MIGAQGKNPPVEFCGLFETRGRSPGCGKQGHGRDEIGFPRDQFDKYVTGIIESARTQQQIAQKGFVVEAQARRAAPQRDGLPLRQRGPACRIERQRDAAPARNGIATG